MNRPLLVASLTEPPSAEGGELRQLAGVADWLEVRADLVGDLDPDWLRERFPGKLLFTLRSSAEGGAFAAGRERRRSRILESAERFDFVDLEGDRDLAPELLERIPASKRLLSWHGPGAETAALHSRFLHLAQTPAAYYKLVPLAAAAGEELPVLELLADLCRSDVVAFATGEIGCWTRIVAPRLGSPLVFGSVGEKPAAPGQLSIARLVSDFGLPQLPEVVRMFGVIGRPALTSLSPRLHNAAYRALGIPALYLPFEIDQFGDFWLEVVESDLLPRLGLPLAGFSVTAPFKEVAFAVAGATSPLADRLQSANSLVFHRGVWEGESTDGEGVLGALAARGIGVRGRHAAVLGSGGAGRAAALALARAGAEVVLVNRGVDHGIAAARLLRLPFVPLAEIEPSRFDLFVHATPLGRGVADELPLAVTRVPNSAVAVDLVYGSEPTRWVVELRRRGVMAIDGREVLLAQAAPQFRMMTGRELPLELGRAVLGLESPS